MPVPLNLGLDWYAAGTKTTAVAVSKEVGTRRNVGLDDFDDGDDVSRGGGGEGVRDDVVERVDMRRACNGHRVGIDLDELLI
jgi:hypothetical protein